MEKGAKPELRLVKGVTVINHYPRMTELARLFPTLDNAPVDPWDPHKLDNWACDAAPSHGGVYAARFMLAVWSGRMGKINRPRKKDDQYRFPVDTYWRCGPFDAVDAMSTWDAMHRAVFCAWVKEPWWP